MTRIKAVPPRPQVTGFILLIMVMLLISLGSASLILFWARRWLDMRKRGVGSDLLCQAQRLQHVEHKQPGLFFFAPPTHTF